MRLLLKLKASHTKEFPYNYHYPLSSAIYKILYLGSPEFADFLHDIGFMQEGKTYKLFTFALRFEKAKATSRCLNLYSPNIDLYLSSPLIDQFIQNFVLGTFENQQIELCYDSHKILLTVSSVEVLPEPEFGQEIKFTLLSPIVFSTKRVFNGNLVQYYLRYNDDINEINRILNKNLLNKFKILNKSITPNNSISKEKLPEQVRLEWDQQYIEKAIHQSKRLTSKTTINATGKYIEVIGNNLPFKLKGNPDLIRVGYLCGFGEKNSMGFGMTENYL